MMGYVSRGAVLALLVLAADCGGQSQRRGDPAAEGTTEPLPPVPLEGLGVATADALCQYYARCSSWHSWVGGCRAVQADMLRNDLQARVERGIARGTVRYDPEVVATCLAALAALDCAAPWPENEGLCSDGLKAFDGTVPADGECIDALECAGDAYCAGLAEACTGRCEPRGTVGESCRADSSDCVFGTECLCETGGCVCRLQRGEGQSCQSRCQGALTCADGRCVRANSVALGQECDSAHLCPADAACAYEGGPSNFLSYCVERALSGGSCTQSRPDMCPDGEWCKPDQFGDSNVGTCTSLDVEGGACNFSTDCNDAWGACVDGICTAYRDIGAACSADEQCWTQACQEGRCVLDTCGADDPP